jgi:hypothetical protein
MGKGTDAARSAGAGLHADVIDDFKDQLLIAFLRPRAEFLQRHFLRHMPGALSSGCQWRVHVEGVRRASGHLTEGEVY